MVVSARKVADLPRVGISQVWENSPYHMTSNFHTPNDNHIQSSELQVDLKVPCNPRITQRENIFPNTYQGIKSIRSPAKVGIGYL